MPITLDIIADKQFTDVGGGYSKNEVDDFLNDILDEMEKRENETNALHAQVASLTKQLEDAKAQPDETRALQDQVASLTKQLANAKAQPAAEPNRLQTESFELVLSKAKSAYEEIVGDADKKAEEIIAKANDDAANIRVQAEAKIADLSSRYESVRQQSEAFYDGVKKLLDDQSGSLDNLKKLLG